MTFINLCPTKDNLFLCDAEVLIIPECVLESLELLAEIRLVETGIKRVERIGKLRIRSKTLWEDMATVTVLLGT